ncbi:MAG: EAL domain-containing protein, partial [Gammaproteobacteria bacterium]
VARPVTDSDGHTTGVIFAALDLDGLAAQLTEVPLPSGSRLTLTDTTGRVLAAYPENSVPAGKLAADFPFVRKQLERDRRVFESSNADGHGRLYAATTLGPANHAAPVLFVSLPTATAFAAANHMILMNAAAMLLVIVGIIILALVAGEFFFVRHIRSLAEATVRVTAGDLDTRNGISNRHGELSELARAFDGMTATLKRRAEEGREQELRIARLNRMHRLLSGINSSLVRAEDRDQLMHKVCEMARRQGGFSLTWMVLLDEDSDRVVKIVNRRAPRVPDSLTPAPGSRIVEHNEMAREAVENRRLVVSNRLVRHTHDSAARRDLDSSGIEACAMIPLLDGDRITGMIGLYSTEIDFFDQAEIDLLTQLGDDVAFALGYLAKSERLDFLAFNDPLTGLANLTLFRDRLEQALIRADSQNRRCGVLIIAIDRLRDINSAHGHRVGDAVLSEAANRLRGTLREGDSAGRLHNDEFGVILADMDHSEDAIMPARKILEAFDEPVKIGELELVVSVKIGISIAPADADSAPALVQNANAALSGLRGGNGERYRFYTPEMQSATLERMDIERHLRHAVDRNQLRLVYQPVVDIRTLKMTGVEALLRWEHPQLGHVSPGRFIPIAEQSGLINRLGDWALREALRQAGQWRDSGLELDVSVNLSVLQLRQPDFCKQLAELTGRAGSSPSLCLELTESKLMEQAQYTLAQLNEIRGLGVRLSIDDFGTGYSSLSYLKQLPVDTIKIDISFIRDIADDPNDASIVRAIISLSHHLDLAVTAEGVETLEQLELLRDFGCNHVQGFLLSPPVPPQSITELADRGFDIDSD